MTEITEQNTVSEKFVPKPDLPPPPNTTGAIGWLRYNLFVGFLSSCLTVLSLIAIGFLCVNFYEWAFTKAVLEATNRQECRITPTEFGTCWAGVEFWFKRFIYGRYTDSEIWRVNSAAIILILWMVPVWLPRVTAKLNIALTGVLIFPFLAGYMFLGGERNWFMEIMVAVALGCFITVIVHSFLCLVTGSGISKWIIKLAGFAGRSERLHKVPVIVSAAIMFLFSLFVINGVAFKEMSNNLWGGLFLTLVISGIGIATALPAGILLALGRRSKMTVIRVLCVAFIELFRSVPLITILFMATTCLLYTSPSPRDRTRSRMPSSA